MTHTLKVAENKDAQIPIPIIYIENDRCQGASTQDSSASSHQLPSYVPESEFLPERGLSFNHQALQFVCWFNDLPPSRQFVFTALSLQHLSSDYLKLVHSVTYDRLAEDYQHIDISAKSNDIDHLNNLDVTSEDFSTTILDLLSSLDIPKERTSDFSLIHDKYLSLVDKALENALQQKMVFEDAFDSLEGQLLIAAMTTPLFTLEDRQWLRKNIKARSEISGSLQSTSLLALANDLLEAFGFLSPSKVSTSRNFRSSSINSPFPFLSRSLHQHPKRRHNSLVPPTSENFLLVPPPFTSPHPFSSSSSPGSSGFVSGSESMYQGLNEPVSLSLRGSRLAPPSNSRLYLLRRQSASPYAPQDGELKEEDDSAPSTSCSSARPQKTGSCSSLIILDGDENAAPETLSGEMVVHTEEHPSRDLLMPPPMLQVVSNLSSPPPYKGPAGSSTLLPNESNESTDLPSLSSFTSPPGNTTQQKSRRRAVSVEEEQIEDPGMAQIPVWLKSLRLHKYVGLFKRLTYYQMLGITDDWLQSQNVTQGARNKILVSIANLATRSATLSSLEKRIETLVRNPSLRSSNLRGCLSELRSLLQTPFPPSPNLTSSSPHYLSSTSSAEDSISVSVGGPAGTTFNFGSDVEDYVEDEGGEEEEEEDVDKELINLRNISGTLCQCPCTNSDTCLFDRTNGLLRSPKRPKSSDGGVSLGPPRRRRSSAVLPDTLNSGLKMREKEDENISEQIMRCLNQGYKALLSEPLDDDDNYGLFMQLLTSVLDHPSFSRTQKDQVKNWQKQLIDRMGPAPPPSPSRRPYHHSHRHHRPAVASRRSSYHPPMPIDRGGSHSAPYTPRSSLVAGGGCGGSGLPRNYLAFPLMRPPFLPQSHHQSQTQAHAHSSPLLPPPSSLLQTPSPFCGAGTGTGGSRRSGGMIRGRSAEPDVYHHHIQQSGPSRSMLHEQTPLMSLVGSHQQRVASMDNLPLSSPFGLFVEPRQVAHPFFTRTRIVSCNEAAGSGDISTSVSPFPSPELQSAAATATGCCFNLLPIGGNVASGEVPSDAYMRHPSPPRVVSVGGMTEQHRWLTDATSTSVVDFSTAEIDRNLELLTEKVTKLAMEESDSPSE